MAVRPSLPFLLEFYFRTGYCPIHWSEIEVVLGWLRMHSNIRHSIQLNRISISRWFDTFSYSLDSCLFGIHQIFPLSVPLIWKVDIKCPGSWQKFWYQQILSHTTCPIRHIMRVSDNVINSNLCHYDRIVMKLCGRRKKMNGFFKIQLTTFSSKQFWSAQLRNRKLF